MRTSAGIVFLSLAALLAGCARQQGDPSANRWFIVSSSLKGPEHVSNVRTLVRRGADAGLNGMVLDAGFDRITLQPPRYFTNLDSVREICDSAGVELIPLMFSAGYGNELLQHDKNLAAAMPVRGVRYAVRAGSCAHVPGQRAVISNGGFERRDGNRFQGYWFHDRPGRVSYADTAVFHGGKSAIRFEKFKKSYKGHARVMQEVEVDTYRNYVITCWVKTEDVGPDGCLRILVLTRDRRDLAPRRLQIPATTDGWMKVELPFNSMGNHKVRVYVGGWGATRGRFWLDDLAIRETALTGLVRRAGAPVTVTSALTGTVYREGADYIVSGDTLFNVMFDRPGAALLLPAGSSVPDGDTLKVDYFHLQPVRAKQVSVCLSEEKLYDVWQAQVDKVHRVLAPRTYFMSMDEIRTGGTCQGCIDRNVTFAEIVGECVARQRNIVRSVNPDAQLWMWSDMFDPGHNAVKNYYLTQGDLDGVWDRIPRDVGIMCWVYGKRKEALRHFSRLGLRTMGACFYDVHDAEYFTGWRTALARTDGAMGMMYTTWTGDYGLLEAFGAAAAPDFALTE